MGGGETRRGCWLLSQADTEVFETAFFVLKLVTPHDNEMRMNITTLLLQRKNAVDMGVLLFTFYRGTKRTPSNNTINIFYTQHTALQHPKLQHLSPPNTNTQTIRTSTTQYFHKTPLYYTAQSTQHTTTAVYTQHTAPHDTQHSNTQHHDTLHLENRIPEYSTSQPPIPSTTTHTTTYTQTHNIQQTQHPTPNT